MNKEQNRQLVNILINGKYDANEVVQELATSNPVLFLTIVERLANPVMPMPAGQRVVHDAYDTPGIHRIARALVTGDYVLSIKELRIESGFGLKEAKDCIDTIRLALDDQRMPTLLRALTDPDYVRCRCVRQEEQPYINGIYDAVCNIIKNQ